MPAEALLAIDGLRKRFAPGAPALLDGLDLAVARGEVVALLGASGSGKTTTLRIVAGLEPADAGCVRLAGTLLTEGPRILVPPPSRGVAMVFQGGALFPHRRALDNVADALRAGSRRARRALAAVALADMDAGPLAERWPHELSGGEEQRVLLARALAARPRLLLLDEAFVSLDAPLRSEILRRTRERLRAFGIATLAVTHDQADAEAFADRIAWLAAGRIHAAR